MSEVKWREGLQYNLDQTLDFVKVRFEWIDWLAEIGADALVSAPITGDTGLTITGNTVVGTYVEALFSCNVGTPPAEDVILQATCQAITSGGQKKARSINFKVVIKQ